MLLHLEQKQGAQIYFKKQTANRIVEKYKLSNTIFTKLALKKMYEY